MSFVCKIIMSFVCTIMILYSIETRISFCDIIDLIDYVNGIGNRSRELYIRTRTPCYSLHPVVRRC